MCKHKQKTGDARRGTQESVGITKFRSHVPTWPFFGEARVVRNFKQEKTVKSQNTQLAGVGCSPCGFLIRFKVSVIKPRHIPQIHFPARLNLACPTFMSCHLVVVVTSGSFHPSMASVALPLVRLL